MHLGVQEGGGVGLVDAAQHGRIWFGRVHAIGAACQRGVKRGKAVNATYGHGKPRLVHAKGAKDFINQKRL